MAQASPADRSRSNPNSRPNSPCSKNKLNVAHGVFPVGPCSEQGGSQLQGRVCAVKTRRDMESGRRVKYRATVDETAEEERDWTLLQENLSKNQPNQGRMLQHGTHSRPVDRMSDIANDTLTFSRSPFQDRDSRCFQDDDSEQRSEQASRTPISFSLLSNQGRMLQHGTHSRPVDRMSDIANDTSTFSRSPFQDRDSRCFQDDDSEQRSEQASRTPISFSLLSNQGRMLQHGTHSRPVDRMSDIANDTSTFSRSPFQDRDSRCFQDDDSEQRSERTRLCSTPINSAGQWGGSPIPSEYLGQASRTPISFSLLSNQGRMLQHGTHSRPVDSMSDIANDTSTFSRSPFQDRDSRCFQDDDSEQRSESPRRLTCRIKVRKEGDRLLGQLVDALTQTHITSPTLGEGVSTSQGAPHTAPCDSSDESIKQEGELLASDR